MKKHYQKFLSFVLIFILVISNCIPVFASGGGHFHNAEEAFYFWRENFAAVLSNMGGILCGDAEGAYNSWHTFLQRKYTYDHEQDEYEWLFDNIEVDNPDNPTEYTLSNTLKNDLNVFINQYSKELDNQQVFTYKSTFTPNVVLKGSYFPNQEVFGYTKDFLNSLVSRYDYVWIADETVFADYGNSFLCYGLTVSQLGVVGSTMYINWERADQYNSISERRNVDTYYYNVFDNKQYKFSSFYDFSQNADNILEYKSGKGSGVISFSASHTITNEMVLTKNVCGISFENNQNVLAMLKGKLFTKDGQKVKSFSSLQDLKDYQAGTVTQPYYKVTPTCSGNTITKNDIDNSVRYGDINNQVITYIINHGGLTEEQLQRLIEAILAGRNNPDPTNPDPTYPDPNNPNPNPWPDLPIPDFTGLFKIIGQLIVSILNGITELLKMVLGELAKLVTELLTSVNQIIQGLTGLFKENIITFISQVLSFLPPEITALISLSIMLSVVLGIIKIIRG